ncbi:dynamin family protein [Okeania sp. KiyG1]|uniref:dynamin family protein n=1 Tax=Okeania sp. KiyG1 TaxID=2720165 RepID=UPI001F37EF21|nr:dynamin family protein [Okeania sp. KiyG1]
MVSPFWDDTKPKDKNEQGGYVDFRASFNTSYSWHNLASKQDGYFKRPLYQTDRDINYIYSVLSDVPIILVHGTIQGVHSAQQFVQRIHPHITFWNLLPEQQDSYTSLNLRFFPLELPVGKPDNPDIYRQMGEYSLNLQDTVSKYLAKGIGLLSSFYHLYRFETRPNLQQFELESEEELEILSLQVNEIYDFLAQKNSNKANYYKLEKSVLSLERNLDEIKGKKKLAPKGNSKLNLEATEVYCCWFAERLDKIATTIIEFEQQEGVINCQSLVATLQESINKLLDIGNLRILIIGDFNRGKSTILNALLGKNLLPTGVTAATAIPTFVKYGKQEKVVVHQKDGTEESLNFEQYKRKYTLNSREVKHQIKNVFKSVGGWLNPLDYAEFYCPIELLSRGVEFIDTAGLNFTEEENKKTFSYIQECHAILFVLAADQQFTQQEKDYLKRLLGIKKKIDNSKHQSRLIQSESELPKSGNIKQVRPIFYLINKWENIEEYEKEEIHEIFVDKFCECLDINQDEAEKMWGNTVFDVYAKTALENLAQGKSLNGTGIKEFQKRLDDLLSNEGLKTKLLQAVQIAEIVKAEIASKVSDKLVLHKHTEVYHEANIKHLQALQDNISAQVEIIEAKYNEIVRSLTKSKVRPNFLSDKFHPKEN